MSEKKLEEIKEITEEDLDQVAGGDDWEDEKSEHLPKDHGRHIGKYEAEGHIGERVYCVDDGETKDFAWGILVRSYEIEHVIGTKRVHDIRIEGWSSDSATLLAFNKTDNETGRHVQVGEILFQITGNKCTLFLYKK